MAKRAAGGFNGAVIPDHWRLQRRPADGELAGFVEPLADGYLPRTVFGARLGEACGYEEAQQLVTADGLRSLAEPWWLTVAGAAVRVQILSAYPGRAEVVEAAYGYYSHDSRRHVVIATDADRMSRSPE